MNLQQKVFIPIVVSYIAIVTVISALTPCNKCGPNRVACKNETSFAYCPNGATVTEQLGNCAKGLICTDGQPICQPRETATKVCGNCDTCVSGLVCRSKTQFEYCKGTKPTGIIGKCPKGQYCSIANVVKNHKICVESCVDEPTCYAEEIISTTPSPTEQQDYTKSCVNAKNPGNYENLADSSCKSYVFCELLNGNMNSVLLPCNNGYFSATDKKCVATKPSKCT